MLRRRVRLLTAPMRAGATTALFLAAIVAGCLSGAFAPDAEAAAGAMVDPLVLVLVGSLFFTVRFDGAAALRRAPRVVLLAVTMNFAVTPLVALALTALLPDDALRVGVLIYCLAPCTDWFLGFTRLARGDTATGAALIPVQMVLQLLLYPVWLGLFAGERVGWTLGEAVPTLLTWFVLPAAIGLGARALLLVVFPTTWRSRAASAVDRAVPLVVAAVIVTIFAARVHTILADPASVAWVLLVVFVFFVATSLLTGGVSRLFRLRRGEHALLTMTTSARNAPLMLAVTTVALPDHPVVSAAIILGMLVEFPHLTVITHLLARRQGRAPDAPTPAHPELECLTARKARLSSS